MRGSGASLLFVLIHSNVWTCPVLSLSGIKYFFAYIDCHSRMTWVYLLNHKDEVFECFKTFNALLILNLMRRFKHSDQPMALSMLTRPLVHLLTSLSHMKDLVRALLLRMGCRRGKQLHLLKVARALMFTMNVPNASLGEAVMMDTFLINRTPFR